MPDDIWYREYLAVATKLDAVTQERDDLKKHADYLEKLEGELIGQRDKAEAERDAMRAELDAERDAKEFIQSELKQSTDRVVRLASNCEAAQRERDELRELLMQARHEWLGSCQIGSARAALKLDVFMSRIDAALKASPSDR